MLTRDDTIAAIATAKTASAIGIVRISGPASATILGMVVPGTSASRKPRRVCAGKAVDPETKETIDEVLCFCLKAPKTATGEDVAEIHGHGGPYIMKKILDAVLRAGAKPAEPGEFTYRAYRNQRIDLTQAEAVMALIGARSDRAARVAMEHLDGTLGRALENKLESLTEFSAELEVGLDYPEEDLAVEDSGRLVKKLRILATELACIGDSFKLGSRLGDGARVVIAGSPNAGKSSLLNKLVGKERALVDAEPGTTRDVVEARGEAAGISLVFYDTAGLRKNAGRVEKQGIKKTEASIESADVVVFVIDGTDKADPVTNGTSIPDHPSVLLAVNKVDLPRWTDPEGLAASIPSTKRIATSAITGEGIDALKDAIAKEISGQTSETHPVLTTARQHRAVTGCSASIETAIAALESQRNPELAAADLREARDTLAELWGRDATDEMLGSIFERFCVGK